MRSKGINGIVERAVQSIEGQIRVMKLALEGRLQRKVDAEANVVTFMAEHAGYLVNRLEVGKDRKNGYERVKGKAAKALGVEFGEKLMWKTKQKHTMEKINPRWEYGVFVGVQPRTGEVWVATKDGLKKARSVKRIPKEDRWSTDSIDWVKHVPWNRYKGDENADGEIPEEKIAEDIASRGSDGRPTVIVKTRGIGPRELQIRKEDAENHGYTRGRAGCSSWFRGLARQPHTESCRRRFGELIKDDARVKNAKKRKEEFEEKALKRQLKKKEHKVEEDD